VQDDTQRWSKILAVTEAAASDFAEPPPRPLTSEERAHEATLAVQARNRMYWNKIRQVVDDFQNNPN
jgi:hypothetical protein